MTVKQIAEAVGKEESTVSRWVKKTSCKMQEVSCKMQEAAKTKKPADYTLEETIAIIEDGMGKNAAGIFRANATQGQPVRTSLNEADIELIGKITGSIVSNVLAGLESRMGKIEGVIETRKALLPAPQIAPRDNVNKIVREYAQRHGIEHREAWGLLYTEFAYRTKTNPRLCAKNRGQGILDFIESEGMIDTLEAVAIDCLV